MQQQQQALDLSLVVVSTRKDFDLMEGRWSRLYFLYYGLIITKVGLL
jgi:hypothetical protein